MDEDGLSIATSCMIILQPNENFYDLETIQHHVK
jgi:hypothetical protein